MVQAATPTEPISRLSKFWRDLRDPSVSAKPASAPQTSLMEAGIHIIADLGVAPPRTLHSAPLVKSSPLAPPVRAMLEAREFGCRFDTVQLDVASVEDHLPGLKEPEGDVQFLADDSSLENLSLSVDGLLQHRKRLLARSTNLSRPRKLVLIVGAGPAGLIAAVQLALRDHHVIVVEQREVYSRNRYIGVYKGVTHLMAALGMPESMTYDFSQYRGKRGIMLADIQTLLHGVALKLGVVIYTGAVVRNLDLRTLQGGEVELQRAQQTSSHLPAPPVGIIRWRHDSICRVSSGATIHFDTILEATGGRSGLRETLVGKDNVVSIQQIGKMAVRQDGSLESFLSDPEDHCAEYVESGYGCPPGMRPAFAAALLAGEKDAIPDEVPCFVSNIDASIFKLPMHQSEGSLGLASRIGDRTLNIPHDWVVLECRVSDQRLSRYHIEGPLPHYFDFGGKRFPTSAVLDKLNPVSLLLRILYAMGVPFDAVDRRQLIDFYTAESSQTDAGDIVGTWIGRFRGLRVGGQTPIWCAKVPGSENVEYGILGESLQNAWYRFGVGVDDSFNSAAYYVAGLELEPEQRLESARRLERIIRSRAVQILYHLYAVARNTDQGVVGPVLTEYHMEEQHSDNLADARLRQIARDGVEMLAADCDIRNANSDPLLESAIDFVRAMCCGRALEVLKSFKIPAQPIVQALSAITAGRPDWKDNARDLVGAVLSAGHRAQFLPLVENAGSNRTERAANNNLRQERLIELAAGRYQWVSPWLRACALQALDLSDPNSNTTLTAAADDTDSLVAEIARSILERSGRNSGNSGRAQITAFERILLLKKVSIFENIPHQLLADVAILLTERTASPQQKIIEKGERGDSLYFIARGRAQVHDGPKLLRVMGENEFFGELSLLDSEPRAASVTALEPTLLFRLAQDDFYALLRERPEITRALTRALCKLVRSA
jgi:hypothetical protein